MPQPPTPSTKLLIHGTRPDPKRQHPVLDLAHWEGEFPLGAERRDGGWIDTPGKLARREQSLRLAASKGTLGPSVPSDIFVWADTALHDKPWLTRIGGTPWREKGKPWPKGNGGIPLVFLGQICFADSQDMLPCKLPGDVALIFGSAAKGWISLVNGSALEWSSLKLKTPEDGLGGVPWNGELPYAYQGVIHRTVQHTDGDAAEKAFVAAGWKDGGSGIQSVQATSIGTYADLPQGWPFEKGDGCTLIATLSSFYFGGKWPLCDVPRGPQRVSADGAESDFWNRDALK
ncbi:MAG TPA: hypothetical protein VFF65_11180, partial [Phycisphaerales bacterium]|nr:hypothetical protein [Phycisphaerales bacterium]